MKKFDCIVVSVHMKATGLANEDLNRLQEEIDQVPQLIKALEQQYPGKKEEEDVTIKINKSKKHKSIPLSNMKTMKKTKNS